MPAGAEVTARAFYVDVLGMSEMQKPPTLARRGGCWFASGHVQIHLGVEQNFRPAGKAHPAFCCSDYEGLTNRLRGMNIEVVRDENNPGVERSYIHDPFGNRIELIKT